MYNEYLSNNLVVENQIFFCFGFGVQYTDFFFTGKLGFCHYVVLSTCIKVWKMYQKKKKEKQDKC